MAAVIQPGAIQQQAAALPRRLRVGLYADSTLQPRWVLEAFARLFGTDYAALAAVAVHAAPAQEAPAFVPTVLAAYRGLDRWRFGTDLSEPKDLSLLGMPIGEGVAHLERRNLDVVFALGAVDDTALDGIARCGVWRWRVDGESEVLRGEPLSASGLSVRLAAGAVPRLAYQSWSRTYPLSVARNRRELLEKTAEFPARALRELQRSGREWLEQCVPLEDRGQTPISSGSVFQVGRSIFRRGMEKALGLENWFLAFRFGLAPALAADLKGFTRIVPPAGATWADPFPLHKDGRYYVFFEELPRGASKAHISMLEVRPDGTWSAPQRVLERDYHLSYPFLLEHEGRLLMIPETAQNRTVEAWRCVEFPLRWRFERVLLDGVRCVDATLTRAADRWWMFANSGMTRCLDDELHIFHAADPLGRSEGGWRPHARNPVKSDVRSARPAGALFWRDGALHRPAQICTPLYGAGVSVNRVQRLTATDYAERETQRIQPAAGSGLLGIHTINRAGDLTVVDAFRRRSRLGGLA
jgi:hypothetical protein